MYEPEMFREIANEILTEYQNLRVNGRNREAAINELKELYCNELVDEDDRLSILIGLSLALCKKKELISSLAQETLLEIEMVVKQGDLDGSVKKYFRRIENILKDDSNLGEEAMYRRRRKYVPDWKNGDLFRHTINYERAETLGINGWSILFYKVGDYIDNSGHCIHIMYVALCPPGKEPTNAEQLQQLGFLRMMEHDNDKWDYWVQIGCKSKNEELDYEFEKIGNYQEIFPPQDQMDENPLLAMHMFGRFKKDAQYLEYEEHICRLYTKFGKYLSDIQ